MLEMKINKLENAVGNARILDDKDIDTSRALILSKVKVKNLNMNKEFEYTLVSEAEADLSAGKISVTSPIGKGLLGKSVGDVAEIEVPSGIMKFEIVKLAKGHTLVVPKKEVDYIFDNDDEVLAKILPFAKVVAKAIEAVVPCERIGISVIGLEVPHTHIHLIPMNSMHDLYFGNERVALSQDEFASIASEIKSHVGK